MKPYILWNSSIVSVKVTVAPLVFCTGSTFLITPVIIYPNRNNILFIILDIWSDIKSYCHSSVFMKTYILAVNVEVSSLSSTFKLYKDFLSFALFREYKLLAVPANGISKLLYTHLNSFIFIKWMWQCNLLPTAIIIFELICTRVISYP